VVGAPADARHENPAGQNLPPYPSAGLSEAARRRCRHVVREPAGAGRGDGAAGPRARPVWSPDERIARQPARSLRSELPRTRRPGGNRPGDRRRARRPG
jgi:hypothetical protein